MYPAMQIASYNPEDRDAVIELAQRFSSQNVANRECTLTVRDLKKRRW
jgi:hypothetical protein